MLAFFIPSFSSFLSLPFAPFLLTSISANTILSSVLRTMPLFRTSFISSWLAYETLLIFQFSFSNIDIINIISSWRAFQLWICSSLSIRGTISKSADSSLHSTFGSSVQSTLSLTWIMFMFMLCSVSMITEIMRAVNAFLSLSDFMYCSTLKQSAAEILHVVNDVGLVLLSLLWFNDAVLYPVPNSINHSFSVGSLLLYCLSIQLISGTLLAFYYIPNIELAFSSID